MSAPDAVAILRQHRPILLACEASGWFHMAGKARMEFLRKHGGQRTLDYDYERWHASETPPFDWDAILGWVRSFGGSRIPRDAWPRSVGQFIENHRRNDQGMLGLLQAGHGVASGIEKNLPTLTSQYLSQSLPHMWLSSPFGHPRRNLFADPPEVLQRDGWRRLVEEIRRVLEELRQLASRNPPEANPPEAEPWAEWRDRAIGAHSWIRQAFLSTLAETRVPNNDVTLWDQSYVAAALFKSAVAGALLDSAFPLRDNQLKQRIRWRLLTVAIGADHYEARAVKIGDWTGMQGALEEFFRRVSQLVEVDLAAGSLLYQDSSTLVFSFPGEGFDEGVPANWVDGFKQWIEGEIHRIAQALNFETPPLVRLSGPTRSLVPIVPERREAQKMIAIPIHKQWGIPCSADGHVCPVCQVRLNGNPTNKNWPCLVCRQRRDHRRDDWFSGRLG
ncbi:MAG: CRISPR-associated protein Csx11, partial [Anaerolineae bacterium]|nr:CRISPR-associated protein Csx11 [Anaerolineae bacterium]